MYDEREVLITGVQTEQSSVAQFTWWSDFWMRQGLPSSRDSYLYASVNGANARDLYGLYEERDGHGLTGSEVQYHIERN